MGGEGQPQWVGPVQAGCGALIDAQKLHEAITETEHHTEFGYVGRSDGGDSHGEARARCQLAEARGNAEDSRTRGERAVVREAQENLVRRFGVVKVLLFQKLLMK